MVTKHELGPFLELSLSHTHATPLEGEMRRGHGPFMVRGRRRGLDLSSGEKGGVGSSFYWVLVPYFIWRTNKGLALS